MEGSDLDFHYWILFGSQISNLKRATENGLRLPLALAFPAAIFKTCFNQFNAYSRYDSPNRAGTACGCECCLWTGHFSETPRCRGNCTQLFCFGIYLFFVLFLAFSLLISSFLFDLAVWEKEVGPQTKHNRQQKLCPLTDIEPQSLAADVAVLNSFKNLPSNYKVEWLNSLFYQFTVCSN